MQDNPDLGTNRPKLAVVAADTTPQETKATASANAVTDGFPPERAMTVKLAAAEPWGPLETMPKLKRARKMRVHAALLASKPLKSQTKVAEGGVPTAAGDKSKVCGRDRVCGGQAVRSSLG
jgi:hypothetical protein